MVVCHPNKGNYFVPDEQNVQMHNTGGKKHDRFFTV